MEIVKNKSRAFSRLELNEGHSKLYILNFKFFSEVYLEFGQLQSYFCR